MISACDRKPEEGLPQIVTLPTGTVLANSGVDVTETTVFPTASEATATTIPALPETSEPTQTETSQESANATTQTAKDTTVQTTEVRSTDPPAKTAAMSAFSIVDVSSWSKEEIRACFYAETISDEVFERMDGKSFKADCTTKRSDLRYVRVLHIGFDGSVRVGELVANKKIAQDFIDIFYELYLQEYPVEKIVPVDEYGADDNLSMADNNTSCFNFRRVVGSKTLSRHALGMAIDVNPLYNPWVYELDGESIVDPPGGAPYMDRTVDCPYIINHDDLFYKLLIQHGFTWGGDWSTSKDYQHFSKTP
jgi:hypothetical protein